MFRVSQNDKWITKKGDHWQLRWSWDHKIEYDTKNSINSTDVEKKYPTKIVILSPIREGIFFKCCNTNLNLIYLKSKMVIEVMIGLSSSQIACAQSYVAIQSLKDILIFE